MATQVILHIGAMKSGTSFIQNVLKAHKEDLKQHGILFPGHRWRAQVSAVYDLIERGGTGQEPMAPDGPWNSMARKVREWPGTVIFSMEFLGPRRTQKIEQLSSSLGETDLQVVLTARDLARQVPAMWQESVQNRWSTTWPEFLELVKAEDMSYKNQGRWFWRHQRIFEIAKRWQEAVGREHLTLITVPPKGALPTLLWDRFAQVAGIPPGVCETKARSNPSLGLASTMVMRDLNELIEPRNLTVPQYNLVMKHGLAKEGLATRKGEPTLAMTERWILKRGEEQVRRLRDLGVRVVGDLDELIPQPVKGVHTKKVGEHERLAAAEDGLAYLVGRQVTLEAQLKQLRREVRARRRAMAEGSEMPAEVMANLAVLPEEDYDDGTA